MAQTHQNLPFPDHGLTGFWATRPMKALSAELGVVSPAHVATLEARIVERQHEVAAEVVIEAGRLIANWGSYYEQDSISKGQANREIDQALKKVLRARGHNHG